MNDRQLDMVLGYLNEGTQIDEIEWLMESINSLINESYELNLLFEADIIKFPTKNEQNDQNEEETAKSNNNISVGTKIKEAIRRFINWIKKIIVNLKATIAKFAGKFNKNYFNKCIDSMINQAEQFNKADKEYKGVLASNKTTASLVRLYGIAKNNEAGKSFDRFIGSFDQMAKVDFQDNDTVKRLSESIVKASEEFSKNVKEYSSDKSGFDSDAYLHLLKTVKNNKAIETFLEFPDKLIKSYNAAYSQVAKIKNGDPKLINDYLSSMTKCCNVGLKMFSYITKNIGSILSFASKQKIINSGDTSGIIADKETDKEINDEIKKRKRK